MNNPNAMTYWPLQTTPSKRKIFISYYGANRLEANTFVYQWATRAGIFIPKTVDLGGFENFINSADANYVMGRIRGDYLGDSTVTIILIGKCTHSRRYVDWELKASLRQGDVYTPNGLIGILLPSAGESAHLPPRFQTNWNAAGNCYAQFHYPPASASELSAWIEDAYSARTTRARLIQNSAEMMKRNAKCRFCGVTHS